LLNLITAFNIAKAKVSRVYQYSRGRLSGSTYNLGIGKKTVPSMWQPTIDITGSKKQREDQAMLFANRVYMIDRW
jgi:hypothetical protein